MYKFKNNLFLSLFCRRMENRDQRRWAIADEDDDGALNKIEFKHFLHPEEADHMRDIVVQVGVNFINVKLTNFCTNNVLAAFL